MPASQSWPASCTCWVVSPQGSCPFGGGGKGIPWVGGGLAFHCPGPVHRICGLIAHGVFSPTFAHSFQTPGQSRKRARASLSDISSLDDVEGLTVRQLKEILACNFVNYSGCCEKWELVEKVSRLYRENQTNHRLRKSSGFLISCLWVYLGEGRRSLYLLPFQGV